MNRPLALLLCLGFAATLGACSEDQKKDTNTAAASNAPQPAQADRSRCDTSGKKVVDIDINGDNKPDVWKIYASEIDNGAKVDVLTCKEVDLNFDGKKDMWVYYDNGGNVELEEFDLDFDGHVDLWTYRQNGKIVRQELDTNFDGKPDIWKFFDNEKLVRVERSSKRNGKVDVWEYYEGGKLDRIGYDTTGSGQIDKWDRAPDDATASNDTVPALAAQGKPAAPAPAAAGTVKPETSSANPASN